LFTIDGERYSVEETLVAGSSSNNQRRYFPGEAIELYVDPNDLTHTIEVDAIEENVVIGVIGIGVAALFAVLWPATSPSGRSGCPVRPPPRRRTDMADDLPLAHRHVSPLRRTGPRRSRH
jgi:hypothetical protein